LFGKGKGPKDTGVFKNPAVGVAKFTGERSTSGNGAKCDKERGGDRKKKKRANLV